jgi:hypothetical protein
LQAALRHPAFGVLLIFVLGIAVRVQYTLYVSPPEAFIASDMKLYVDLAHRLETTSNNPLGPWDVTHPLGYPTLLSWMMPANGSLKGMVALQIAISSLIPLALGLLGLAAFGWRTALAMVAFGSIYFPFIEYGALFLSEIHFIFWMTLAFAAFLGATRVEKRATSLVLAASGGLALSIAIAMKSVALPAAVVFFAVEAMALLLASGPGTSGWTQWRGWLPPWLLRGVAAALAAAPVLGALARVCTRANRGQFCVTGNKVGSDFLLGHYGRIADITWAGEDGHGFQFGSPSSHLRHYDEHPVVPFFMTDNKANVDEAWRWIFRHPFDAVVLSLDHVYDTFFGAAMWPTFNTRSWPYAHLSQYAFVALLFVPTVLAFASLLKRGARAFLTSRTFLVFSPVLAVTFTVMVATGEPRYRIPFDVFFITIACAYFVGDVARVDGAAAPASARPKALPA